MPAPGQLTVVAYLVIIGAPLLLLLAYLYMYNQIGAAGLTGSGLTEGA